MADRLERTANPLVLVIFVLAVGFAGVALWLAPHGAGVAVVTTMIIALAFFGGVGLLLFAFGLLQFAIRAARFDTVKAVVELEPGRNRRHRPRIREFSTPTKPIVFFRAASRAAN